MDVLVLLGDRPESAVGGGDEPRQVVLGLADLGRQHVEAVDQVGEVLPALGDLGVELGQVTVDRADGAEQLAELLVATVEPVAGTDQQQAQIGLRVGVERLEDLVEVDVGRRVGDGDHVALLELARLLAPGIELEEHVLEAGRRAHQDRRVAVDRQELAVDIEGDHADAVLDAHVR